MAKGGKCTQDKPGAKDLVASKCSVEFDNVSFSYHADSPVVKGISFYCPGGQTLALVGATGEFSDIDRFLIVCTAFLAATMAC